MKTPIMSTMREWLFPEMSSGTIFDATTGRYVRAAVWCAHNSAVCARTGSQNAQARTRGDSKDGA